MPSAASAKARKAGVSASSFFDLKAELSKKEAEHAKAKSEGRNVAVVGGIPRVGKKPTVWARQNKGVKERANKDAVELEEISKPTLEAARSVLERKAKIYEKLRKGKTGGLNDAQYDALLVDFDSQPSSSKYYEEHSSDEDESLTVPKLPPMDDPLVEYEDEFGRIRTARRSEVPRNLVLNQEDQVDEDEDIIIRNPVNHFPIYEPNSERIAEVAQKYAEDMTPLNVHYDASREVRAKGAGFYQFSGDEETRRAQMEELKASREETMKVRQELGAEDAIAGQEGMVDSGPGPSGSGAGKSRAMEKRKRDIEERRKLLDAKRRKVNVEAGSSAASSTLGAGSASGGPSSSMGPPPILPIGTENPISKGNSPPADSATTQRVQSPTPTEEASFDPFAALEAQSALSTKAKPKNKGKNKVPAPPAPLPTETDSFLAQLEEEFLGSKRKR